MHSSSLCLLLAVFRPFILTVIIDSFCHFSIFFYMVYIFLLLHSSTIDFCVLNLYFLTNYFKFLIVSFAIFYEVTFFVVALQLKLTFYLKTIKLGLISF